MASSVPEPFRDLEPFTGWALPTMEERLHCRLSIPYEDAKAFYDAMFPRIEEVIEYLDRNPLDHMPKENIALFHMLLSLAEISTSVEIYGEMTCPLGIPHADFPMWQSRSDF